MAGLFARWAALILAAYTLVLALIFHTYWGCNDSDSAASAEARIA